MRILAIDPGFGRVGVALLEGVGGKEKLLYSDCIETDKGASVPDRLAEISGSLRDLIAEWQPKHLATEKLFFTTNQKTVMQVSEARGAIVSTCRELGLEVYEYTPLVVKAAVTGYGKASKAQVADMVRKLIKLDKVPRYDDEYDAIAVGLCHMATVK